MPRLLLLFTIAGFFLLLKPAQAQSLLFITEIQLAGDTSKHEFIEIYNPSETPINLQNYKLSKQTKSGNQSNLVTKFPELLLPSQSYLLIAHPDYTSLAPTPDILYSTKGSIANHNTIILYDANGEILDLVGFGDASNFQGQAAPNPAPNSSLSRNFENGKYINTNNNAADFQITSNPTPAQDNIFINDSKPTPDLALELEPEPTPHFYPGVITINEVYPAPKSGENEWVEIYNQSGSHITLQNWFIVEGSGKQTPIEGIIGANGYLLINNIKGNLNNSGDTIKILFKDTIIDSFKYGSKQLNPSKGESLARPNPQNDNFVITTTPTPGQANLIELKVKPKPKPKIIKETDKKIELKPELELNTENYINNKPIPQSISEPPEKLLLLCPPPPTIVPETKTEPELDIKKVSLSPTINEFIPNPKGSDDQEWIELYNTNSKDINLDQWYLDDSDGGSKPYQFKETVIKANAYLVINKAESKLTLNNSSDSVRLLRPDQSVSDQIDYDDIDEGLSYARNKQNQWQSTIQPTPGTINEIVLSTPSTNKPKSNNLLTITGTALSVPGTLGKQIFFLVDDNNKGWQIYMSKADWPNFELNDTLKINGKLSGTYYGHKLNISNRDSITIITTDNTTIEPLSVTTNDITEELLAQLITITGTITQIKGRTLWLDDDHGEVPIYLKFDKPDFKTGDDINIIGILTETSQTLKIWPRDPEDFTLIKAAPASKPTLNINPTLPAPKTTMPWQLLTYTSIIANLIMMGLMFKPKVLS